MPKKQKYRIKNWKKYTEALVQRGSITVWIAEDALQGWIHKGTRTRGRPFVFSAAAIRCALTVRAVFRLPLRQTEGFLRSVFALMHVSLPVPDYSTLSLRAKTLRAVFDPSSHRPVHLVLDSTGLKIRGEGEWRRRQGKSGHRKWRKFHIGIDATTQEILIQELSLSRVADATAGVRLIERAPGALSTVTADGSYDKVKIYDVCERRKARPLIPPRKDAKIQKGWKKDVRDKRYKRRIAYLEPRHDAIRRIRKGGRKRWKRESGYHRRSLVETAFSRTQRLFGQGLRSRRMARQRTETFIRCTALNHMTALGMPETIAVP